MKTINIIGWFFGLLLLLISNTSFAMIDTYTFSSDLQRERYHTLTTELRCPKCQNEDIADSNAPIANDLRKEVYRLLQKGKTDQQIIDYLVARYGEFILYNPPIKFRTLLLWYGPFVLLFLGLISLIVILLSKRRAQQIEVSHLSTNEKQRLKSLLQEDSSDKENND